MNPILPTARPLSPQEAAQLIESDELARYVTEQLGGQIVAVLETGSRPLFPHPELQPIQLPLTLGILSD